MKWLRRAFFVIAGVIALVLGLLVFTALRTERPVGFEVVQTSAGGKPFAMGLWYPTDATPRPTTMLGLVLMSVAPDAPVAGQGLPLVVISHGNGGGPASHVDLALSLANAGYVVAAPMHPGDNAADQSAAGSPALYSERNAQVRATLDYLLSKWRSGHLIDPMRAGAYGFSAGAFTVLTAAGAKPDFGKIPTHCAAHPEFICEVFRHHANPLLDAGGPLQAGEFAMDTRIRAAVLAAPGLGFTLDRDGLATVRIPIQLWSGELDRNVPYSTNAKLIREGLDSQVQFHAVPGAGHAAFLAPCALLGPPQLCRDEAPFDRKQFHADMNARVIAFFDEHLGRRLAPDGALMAQ